MVVVPFVYFSWLAYYMYRKNKTLDLAVYIALIYAVLGLFAIAVDVFDMRRADTVNYNISFVATFAYCSLTTLGIIPIYKARKYYSISLRAISKAPIRFLSWLFFIYAFIAIFLMLPDIKGVLTGDLASLRSDVYNGFQSETWMDRIPPVIRIPFTVMNLILGSSWIPIFLAFYSSTVLMLERKYVLMLLIVSLLGPLEGIVGVDRGAVFHWLVSLGGCFVFFRPMMTKKTKRKWYSVLIAISGAFILYLSIMTIARFGERTTSNELNGTQFGIIDYLGQAFTNFCFFFDTFELRMFIPAILFPFTSSIVFGSEYGTLIGLHEYLEKYSGVDFGVFVGYQGNLVQALGQVGMIVYLILLFIISYIILFNSRNRYTLFGGYLYMFFATIPMLGMFVYYYSAPTRTISVFFFLVLLLLLKPKEKPNEHSYSR